MKAFPINRAKASSRCCQHQTVRIQEKSHPINTVRIQERSHPIKTMRIRREKSRPRRSLLRQRTQQQQQQQQRGAPLQSARPVLVHARLQGRQQAAHSPSPAPRPAIRNGGRHNLGLEVQRRLLALQPMVSHVLAPLQTRRVPRHAILE